MLFALVRLSLLAILSYAGFVDWKHRTVPNRYLLVATLIGGIQLVVSPVPMLQLGSIATPLLAVSGYLWTHFDVGGADVKLLAVTPLLFPQLHTIGDVTVPEAYTVIVGSLVVSGGLNQIVQQKIPYVTAYALGAFVVSLSYLPIWCVCSYMDNRAQGSIGLARFFLALGAGAIMLFIIQKIASPMLSGARTELSPARTQGTDWLAQGVELLPIFILLIALLSVVILAIYQREVVR